MEPGCCIAVSLVTAWSFSSSLTIARQTSDERSSVAKKCLRECTLARAAGADQHDEGEVGDFNLHVLRSLGLSFCRPLDHFDELPTSLDGVETTLLGEPPGAACWRRSNSTESRRHIPQGVEA